MSVNLNNETDSSNLSSRITSNRRIANISNKINAKIFPFSQSTSSGNSEAMIIKKKSGMIQKRKSIATATAEHLNYETAFGTEANHNLQAAEKRSKLRQRNARKVLENAMTKGNMFVSPQFLSTEIENEYQGKYLFILFDI